MDAKTKEAIDLLGTLIATPSPSRDESRTADLIFAYLAEHGAAPEDCTTTFSPAPQASTRRARRCS